MPLVPCRGCGYQVDTSALACPKCGATDPAKKICRQHRQAVSLSVQLLVGLVLLLAVGRYVWVEFMPLVKTAVAKQHQG